MNRLLQFVLIASILGFSWLGMQAVHELGHVLVARFTGAEVIKVVLHPLTISRTDVGETKHPLAVVWGGPIGGCLVPLLLFGISAWLRFREAYLLRFFTGFCFIANGVYIGMGRFLEEGADPKVMTDNGSPQWVLVLFGLITFPVGLYLWHRQGTYFGFGHTARPIDFRGAAISTVCFLFILTAEIMHNSR